MQKTQVYMKETKDKETICKEYGELLQGIFNSQNQQQEIKSFKISPFVIINIRIQSNSNRIS